MKTILVVDDEYAITETLAELLEDEGYRVVTARNGAEGLRRLQEDRPDLALVDLMMPVMDGWQMLRAMQDDPHLATVPAIAMSAGPANFDGKLPSVTAFVSKPFRLEALLTAVNAAIAP